ncbi:MAG: hypothetical protein NC314_02525 [Roseburia sp.]|nr:hypothetical protein [Ruminococcus sp.]MCM1154605.1 hypothetical protein [Roseburia sp.]MCM1241690.1 hypothetical protein [Roseburia sp.]
MNAWIILLFCLLGNSGGRQGNNGSCPQENESSCGCGNGRETNFGRGRNDDCDFNDFNESRFEPRFEARPFAERETCGCEENSDQ